MEILSGLNNGYDYIEMTFHTSLRNSGTISEPSFIIPQMAVKAYRPISAIIPLSLYVFHQSYRDIFFVEQATSSTIRQASLTPGSYNSAGLCTELAAQMTAAGSGTYTVSYNSSTFELTITGPGSFKILSGYDTSPYLELGLDSTNLDIYGSTITTNPIDLVGPKALSIVTSSLSTKNFLTNSSQNLVLTIPIQTPVGTVSVWSSTNQNFFEINQSSVCQLNFAVQDEYQRRITLLRDYQFTIGFLLE